MSFSQVGVDFDRQPVAFLRLLQLGVDNNQVDVRVGQFGVNLQRSLVFYGGLLELAFRIETGRFLQDLSRPDVQLRDSVQQRVIQQRTSQTVFLMEGEMLARLGGLSEITIGRRQSIMGGAVMRG